MGDVNRFDPVGCMGILWLCIRFHVQMYSMKKLDSAQSQSNFLFTCLFCVVEWGVFSIFLNYMILISVERSFCALLPIFFTSFLEKSELSFLLKNILSENKSKEAIDRPFRHIL